MLERMTEPRSNAQIRTQNRVLGRTIPRSLSIHAARRFGVDRRARYLARLGGREPTDAQAALIQSLISTEWTAVRNESLGTLPADRLALDARRLFTKLLAEFERSLRAPPPAERPPSLAEVLAEPRL
jgi:hypothetical protein